VKVVVFVALATKKPPSVVDESLPITIIGDPRWSPCGSDVTTVMMSLSAVDSIEVNGIGWSPSRE
tara:strand:- start:79 stop:273 length:195 start_codon:yes stop_codon:yes gene_type:complete